MTNGNGGPPTPAAGLPRGGGASPQGGTLTVGQGPVGQGPGGPGAVSANGPAAQPGLPVPAGQPRRGMTPLPGGGQAPPRKGSPFSISNWRVRWRLIAIITVPTVTALILGVIQIVSAVDNYSSYKRTQDLASMNGLVVSAAGLLADERDDSAGFVAAGGQQGSSASSALKKRVSDDVSATDTVTGQISAAAPAIVNGTGYRSQTVLDLTNGVLASISDLKYIRQTVTATKAPATSVILEYNRVIQAFIAFSNDTAGGSSSATLQSDVAGLNALLRMENDASTQRAYLYQALAGSTTAPVLAPTALTALNQAFEEQVADAASFDQSATVTQQQNLDNTVAGPKVDEAKSAEQLAIATATAGQPLSIGNPLPPTCVAAREAPAACWMDTQTQQITLMRSVSNGLANDITAQANSLETNALHTAVWVSVATLVLLILVLLITTFVARSMIRPLRKLRSDALEVAGSKLPAMVRRLSESEGGDASAEIEPIGVNSTDEIGEVARAFDQVHREAVRLAADEAMLRGNLNAMFVNLSRRSQSLIERQLSLIDNLEQSEQDADRLSSLFRLDHLATRMRRNSENLLVLAGHEAASRRWSQPVPLVDVLRAAISEIEQYERVVLNVQPGIQVVGQAVNDIVHLVAEIVENATTFSPEDTQVYVTGQPLTSGGVLLDITDNGVGIADQEMAHANWRLDNPPVVDVAVSRRMGLFVVGRLAARHGVRVRLRHAQSGGLTALIWLPESVATPDGGNQTIGRLRKFEADDYGPAPSLSAPTTAPAPPAPAGPVTLPGAPAPAVGGTGFSGAAATASRIPRLGGAQGGNGGFGAFGNAGNGGGNGTGTRPAPVVPSAPGAPGAPAPNGAGSNGNGANGGGSNGSAAGGPGPSQVIDAPGGPLPVRTPGNHPLGPATPAGGGSAFGADAFGDAFGGDTVGEGDFTTTRMPALGGDGGSAGTGTVPAAVPNGSGASGSDGSQVTIPPTVSAAVDHRLPIFDSLESDWFRRSGKSLSTAAAPAAGQAWNASPADEGWAAARIAAEPEATETTTAGLPKRVPRANLVPGSVGGTEETESAPPARSAETMRNRMASFQRGVREARAAGPTSEEP
jgi:signal transduction histidine kinase